MPTSVKPCPQNGLSTFSWHARVLDINGVAPTTEVFEFWVGHFSDDLPEGAIVNATGTNDTGWQTATGGDIIGLDAASIVSTNRPIFNNHYDGFVFILAARNALTHSALPQFSHLAGEFLVHETQELVSWTAEMFDLYVGAITWRDAVVLDRSSRSGISMTGGTARAATLDVHLDSVYGSAFADIVGATVTPPTRIVLADTFNQVEYTTERAAALSRLMLTLGHNEAETINAINQYAKGFARSGTLMVGITSFSIPGYMWPWGAAGTISGDLPTPAGIANLAANQGSYCDLTSYGRDAVRLCNLSDEPAGIMPTELDSVRLGTGNCRDNSAMLAAQADFRAYLADQNLTAADIGMPLASALPIGQSSWAGTLQERTLFYWSMRWYSHVASTLSAAVTSAMKAQFPKILTATNWNNFSGRWISPASYTTGVGGNAGTLNNDRFELGSPVGGT